MDQVEIFKALSNKTRLQILRWLKDPALHFPEHQVACGETDHGVCVGHIHKKAGLTQSTISAYQRYIALVWLRQPGRGSGPIIKEMKKRLLP